MAHVPPHAVIVSMNFGGFCESVEFSNCDIYCGRWVLESESQRKWSSTLSLRNPVVDLGRIWLLGIFLGLLSVL